MGLDQQLFAYSGRNRKEVDFTFKDDSSVDEIQYWRKHPNLEQWMSELYFSKGGKGMGGMNGPDTFNCCRLELTIEDLNQLEEDVLAGNLPQGGGFFWGSDSDEHYKVETLDAIRAAKWSIETEGKRIFYTSWW